MKYIREVAKANENDRGVCIAFVHDTYVNHVYARRATFVSVRYVPSKGAVVHMRMSRLPKISLPCAVALALAVASGILTVIAAGYLPKRVATHWNGAGVADDWCNAWTLLALAAVAPVVALVLLIAHLTVLRGGDAQFGADIADLIGLPVVAVFGLIGLAGLQANLSVSQDGLSGLFGLLEFGLTHVFVIAAGLCMVIAAVIVLFASSGRANHARRVVGDDLSTLQHLPPNPSGSCLFDLAVARIRVTGAALLCTSGLACVVAAAFSNVDNPWYIVPGGIAGLLMLVLPTLAFVVVFAMSNTAVLRLARMDAADAGVD